MKKLLITVIIFSFLFVGCQSEPIIETVTEYETIIETVVVTVTIEDTDKIEQLESELEDYRNLIYNLNELLSNVYYGYASNENYILDGFTAFSIEYKDKFYLVTAGHCVEQDGEKFYNHRFKANFSDEWIYPELIDYKYIVNSGPDYAIFYNDLIDSGLKVDRNNTKPNFRLGTIHNNLNVIKQNIDWGMAGECGSPIINLSGDVIGINVGFLIDIDIVLEVIDYLE